MAIIVNDPRNLPVSIIIGDMKRFEANGIPEVFIKELLKHPKNGVGVERNNYYIITTQAMLRFIFPKFINSFLILRELMDYCWMRNIHFIMINK